MDVISASPPPSYDDVPPLTPPEAPSLPLSLNSLAQSQSGPLSSSSSYSASAVLTPIRRSQLQTTSSTRTMSSSSSSPDEDSELSEGDPGYLDPADFPEDDVPFSPKLLTTRIDPKRRSRPAVQPPILLQDNTASSRSVSSGGGASSTTLLQLSTEPTKPRPRVFARTVALPSYLIVGQTANPKRDPSHSGHKREGTGGGSEDCTPDPGCWVVYELQVGVAVEEENDDGTKSTRMVVVKERKRYSEFVELRRVLRRELPHLILTIPELPPKRALSRFRPSFLEHRRERLQDWLRVVLLHPELGGSRAVKEWLLF